MSKHQCWNCEEWEPIINTGCGWCPVFQKETQSEHGMQCTAFKEMFFTPPPEETKPEPPKDEVTEALAQLHATLRRKHKPYFEKTVRQPYRDE